MKMTSMQVQPDLLRLSAVGLTEGVYVLSLRADRTWYVARFVR
jgi:hypothetical protein